MKPLTKVSKFLVMIVMLLSLAISGTVSASDAEQSFQQPMLVVNTSFLNVRTGPGVEYTVLVTVVGGTELPVLGLHSDGIWYQVNTDAGPGWVNIEFTLPRGDFSNLPLLAAGDTGAVNLGQGGGGETSDTRTTTPVLGGNTVVINTGFLNLRSGPNVGNSVITTVPGGTELVVLGRSEDNVWLLVQGNFGEAWVNSEFTLFRGNYATVQVASSDVMATSEQNSNVVIINTGFLNLRNGPSIGNSVVATVAGGTELAVLGRSEDNVWLLVQGDFGQAWVNNEFTLFRGNYATVQVVGNDSDVPDTNSTTVNPASGNHIVVNTGTLNVRSGPSAGFSVVATVQGGTELAVLGRSEDNVWLLVQGDFGQAWVNNEFTLFRGNYATVQIVSDDAPDTNSAVVNLVSGNHIVVNTGNLNVRSGPNASFSIVATVPGATELAVVGRADDGVWYYIEGTFGRGWVNSEFVLFRGDYGTVPVVDLSGS